MKTRVELLEFPTKPKEWKQSCVTNMKKKHVDDGANVIARQSLQSNGVIGLTQ